MRMKSTFILKLKFMRKTGLSAVFQKFTLSLLIILFSQSVLNQVFSQNSGLTLNMKNVTIESVLNTIESKTQYRFLYNKELVDVSQKTSIVVTNADITSVLNELFKGSNITFSINGKQIVLSKHATEQPKNVIGTVTDEQGTPIIGATVLVKGTKTGTITNYSGSFSLDIDANEVLAISYIGYVNKEIKLNGQHNITIKLAEDIKSLSEVVVTALGIKREQKSLGYAVQAVAGDGIQTVKGIDMATSLTGKVAGLMIKNSTEFVAEPTLTLRGETPILVVDGVPFKNMSLRDIPSDDIENISVLKGGTASALYGEDGDRGAIMVTTKKGKKTKGLSVSINSGTMFTAGYLAIPELQSTYGRALKTNADGKLEYVRSGDGSWGAPMEGQEVIQWDPVSKTMKSMPYLPIGKDNFKNYLEQGYILNNNINVTQQGENGSLRTSATWVQNKGQYPNSKFDKLTYSIGGDMKFGKLTISSSFTYNKNKTPNKGFSGYTGYDPMYGLLIWSAADWNILDYKDYWLVPNEVQNNSYTAGNNNPWFDRYERTHSMDKDILNGVLEINYDIQKWLKAKIRTGYETYSNRQEVKVSKGSFQGAGNAMMIPNGTEVWGESQKGSYNLGISRGYSTNNEALLLANHKFGDFNIDGMIGTSLRYYQDEGIETRTRSGLSIPGFYSLKASIDPVLVASNIYRKQTNSVYGRLAADWKDILFVEATFRNDWTSTLSAAQRSYFYPSVSGSFLVSEVLPKLDWLSFWKIRSSWVTSKKTADIYSINNVYTITNAAWGTLSTANYPTSIRSSDIFPESTSTIEIGTAINLFKNKVSLDIAYYSKDMFDFIKSASVSSASGFNSNYLNIDEVRTRKGLEVALNVTPIKNRDWQLDFNANWTSYKTVFTKLDPLYSGDKPWIKVGERTDYYLIRDFLKDPSGNIIHNSSGLPLFSSYDSNYGYSDPKYIWGLGANLRYKNWQLGISVDGRVGGLAQTITEMYMWRSGSHPNSLVPERYLDATVAGSKNYLGTGVKVVSGTATYDTYGNITSDTRVFAANDVKTTYKSYIETYHKGTAWGGAPSPCDLYDATFFKIRELSLTYNLPGSVCSKISAQNLSISAIGQNVFLWAKQFKYSDIDGGSENFSDPSQRYIGVNIKVGF